MNCQTLFPSKSKKNIITAENAQKIPNYTVQALAVASALKIFTLTLKALNCSRRHSKTRGP